LKTTTLGYDGKGQVVINETDDLKKISFENEYILEEKIKLNKEISVIVTRYQNGECALYDPIENIHQDQILDTSTVPAKVDEDIIRLSKDYAKILATKLNYTGTMCVEYFINDQKELLVNEIAPRVHNSGHLTINAYNISQFESHVRAVCNLEKIEPKLKINAQMKNIIGKDIFKYREQKFKSNEYFFDYLKTEVKPKRKMGHLTTTQD
jgi:5-(carboxyamino)imidazole ribonucleotide synthase